VLGFRFGFSILLASVVQPNTHLSCVSVTLQAVDEYVFKSALADLSPLRLHGFIDQRTNELNT